MEGNWKDKISTPALVVDYDLMQKNIKTMANFAREKNINLRPHVKTHKCPEIAKMMLEAGASGICVAKVGEAEIFAESGLNDILIANQVIDLGQIKRLIELNKKTLVRVCVDSEKNVKDLSKAAQKEGISLEVVLEIDIGLGRNGIQPGEPALNFAKFLQNQKNIKLVGLQGYEGHLISVLDPELREQQAHNCMQLLVDTRDLLNENGININYLTGGNTTTYRFTGSHEGITEIQPGTYVFNDEHHYRVCPEFEVAATVLCAVSNNPTRRIYTVDAGLKSVTNDNGNPTLKNYPKSKIKVMTEEHSIIRTGPKDTFEIGQKIEIIPSHICTTVNLYDFLTVVKDDDIIEIWDVSARGKNY